MSETIEVRYAVAGTTQNDVYTADKVLESQMLLPGDEGGCVAVIRMQGGRDEHGSVRTVQYAQAYRIVRRPTDG